MVMSLLNDEGLSLVYKQMTTLPNDEGLSLVVI